MDWFEDTAIFIFLIPTVVFICVFLSYLKFKRLANPITFMTIWWGGWLFIANLSLTGIYNTRCSHTIADNFDALSIYIRSFNCC